MKKVFIVLLLALFIFGCGKEKKPEQIVDKKIVRENLFKNMDVEKLSKRLESEIEKSGMAIDFFEDLNSDGKVYYYSTLNNNKNQVVTINYENLTPTAIVGKVIANGEEEMEIFKKLSLSIIKASDTDLTDEDCELIYEELLTKLEGSTSSIITTKNTLTYGLKVITGAGDELVIYVK